jgi:LemA protein
VRDYNIKTQIFPSSLVAGVFNFKKKEMFEIKETAEREAPEVKF